MIRRAVDTNVLIYAHIPSFAEHEVVRAYLIRQLRQQGVQLVVTPGILHEFVHVITDSLRFEPPVKMLEALALARLYLERTNVECVCSDEQTLLRAFDLMEEYRLGRKRIADTLLATVLLQNGVNEIITCNPDDFKPFVDLQVIDPRH